MARAFFVAGCLCWTKNVFIRCLADLSGALHSRRRFCVLVSLKQPHLAHMTTPLLFQSTCCFAGLHSLRSKSSSVLALELHLTQMTEPSSSAGRCLASFTNNKEPGLLTSAAMPLRLMTLWVSFWSSHTFAVVLAKYFAAVWQVAHAAAAHCISSTLVGWNESASFAPANP